MITLKITHSNDPETNKIEVTVFLVSTSKKLIGGFSLKIIASSNNGLPAPLTQAVKLGSWDLFDANLTQGNISGISTKGYELQENSPTAIFKFSFDSIDASYGFYKIEVNSTGEDTFFDDNGLKIPYVSNLFTITPPAGGVNILGELIEGSTLTAINNLSDPDGIPKTGANALYYEWQADGSIINNTSTNHLLLTPSLVGKKISVSAIYTDFAGNLERFSSELSVAVINVNDLPTGSVTISGTTTQGQVLTAANTLADIDGLGEITYQWLADGANIAGATASTLTLAQAQVGKAITVRASYTDAFGQAESVTSPATALVANVNDLPTGTLTISGTATQGQVLTAANTMADLDGLGEISYQWLADGVNISGATASTLTLAQALVGKAITVRASYTDGFGQAESVTSTATALVTNVNDQPTGTVSISGAPTPGQTLTAANTLADIDGLGEISYQWLANGAVIVSATSNTFLITQDQAGQQISVRASYTDLHGTSESVDSASLKINTPPVARNNTYTIAEDDTLVLGNVISDGWAPGTAGQTQFHDTDADGDALSISAVTVNGLLTAWADLPNSTDPSDLADAQRGIEWKTIALPNGTAWLQATGGLRYAGKANDTLGDTLSYTITDGQGGTAIAQVQIKVLPVDDPTSATLSISGSAKTGGALSLNVSNITDPDGLPSLAYQWQWLSDQTWQDIEGATSDTWDIPTGGLWAERAVRAQLSTTDPLGGKSVFHSGPQTIEASSQLMLGATHWKSGKALQGVGVGLFDDATEFKTGSDGTLNAQGFQDPDGVDDGLTVLNPRLAADPKQASITLTDVLGALKVYLGKPLPEAYNNDLKFIAADFDGNGSVNLTDVLGLLKFYLNKPVNAGPAWVFVDIAQTTTVNGQTLHWSNKTGQTLSNAASAPATILADLNSDEPVQLVGVLRGDVDGSWIG